MSRIEIPKILYYFLRLFSKKINYKKMSEEDIEDLELYLVSSFSSCCNRIEISDFSDIRILKEEERWDIGVEDYTYILLMVKYQKYYYLWQENIV